MRLFLPYRFGNADPHADRRLLSLREFRREERRKVVYRSRQSRPSIRELYAGPEQKPAAAGT